MADGELMIASAVVIPDFADAEPMLEAPSVPASTHKRRQSDFSEPDASKRARLSPEHHVNPKSTKPNGSGTVNGDGAQNISSITDTLTRRAHRREAGKEEERKRGQRMFGALLGTLSARSSGRTGAAVEKRRADIEKRAQAKIHRLDQTDRKKEQIDSERIKRRRRREQWIVEEQAMRTRHGNLLATARFIRTKTEPRLFYKPWELSIEEEELIARQINETKSNVDQEWEDFDFRRRASLEELDKLDEREDDKTDKSVKTEEQDSDMVDSEPPKEMNGSHHFPLSESTNIATPSHHETPPKREPSIKCKPSLEVESETAVRSEPINNADLVDTSAAVAIGLENEELDEHHGETVLEAEEDTVIY